MDTLSLEKLIEISYDAYVSGVVTSTEALEDIYKALQNKKNTIKTLGEYTLQEIRDECLNNYCDTCKFYDKLNDERMVYSELTPFNWNNLDTKV